MVGHAILRTIVGADLLGAITMPDLTATLGTKGLLLFLKHLVIETCTQDLQRRLTILDLGLLVLRLHDEPRGKMRDAHGGVGRVDALATGAAGAIHVDTQVLGLDVDLDLIGLGQDGNGRRRSVNAALALGLGHALHAMHAALELHGAVDAVA